MPITVGLEYDCLWHVAQKTLQPCDSRTDEASENCFWRRHRLEPSTRVAQEVVIPFECWENLLRCKGHKIRFYEDTLLAMLISIPGVRNSVAIVWTGQEHWNTWVMEQEDQNM
jgi:hypothetical protein